MQAEGPDVGSILTIWDDVSDRQVLKGAVFWLCAIVEGCGSIGRTGFAGSTVPTKLIGRAWPRARVRETAESGMFGLSSWSHMVRMDPTTGIVDPYFRACPATLHGSGPLA